MINFNDLPGDIKSKIFKINKDREREEHWKLLMNQVGAAAVRWSSALGNTVNTKNKFLIGMNQYSSPFFFSIL